MRESYDYKSKVRDTELTCDFLFLRVFLGYSQVNWGFNKNNKKRAAPKTETGKKMGRTEARMRKELADRGVRVSEAWSRGQLEAALARARAKRTSAAAGQSRPSSGKRRRNGVSLSPST